RDAVTQRAGLGGHAAAVHARHDVHAGLVAHGLQRLADGPLQRVAREEHLERLAVDDVLARARPERDARDSGLALAGGGVAGPGGQVDRRLGDDLRKLLVGLAALGDLLVVLVLAVARTVAEGLLALAHDVDLEIHAGDRRLLARALLDILDVLRVGRGTAGGH